MASEKEKMQVFKTIGAAFFAVGLVCAELLASGCGAEADEAAADLPFITTFHVTEPQASEAAVDYGSTSEALTSSSVIPLFYGHLKGGCTIAEDVGCGGNLGDGRNSYCPHVGTGQFIGPNGNLITDDCLVPLTRIIKVGINFNVAIGPESQVNFRQAYTDMINSTASELSPSGWGITSLVGNAPAHVAFGSLPVDSRGLVLADTSCSTTRLACVTLPGRGDTHFCQYDTSTCTTVFDEHHIAQTLAAMGATNPTAKYNFVRNIMKHEFGHMIGLDHIGDRSIMEADQSNTLNPTTLQTYDNNQLGALKNYRP